MKKPNYSKESIDKGVKLIRYANNMTQKTVESIVEEVKTLINTLERNFKNEIGKNEVLERVTRTLAYDINNLLSTHEQEVRESENTKTTIRELGWVRLILGYKHPDEIKGLIDEKLLKAISPQEDIPPKKKEALEQVGKQFGNAIKELGKT